MVYTFMWMYCSSWLALMSPGSIRVTPLGYTSFRNLVRCMWVLGDCLNSSPVRFTSANRGCLVCFLLFIVAKILKWNFSGRSALPLIRAARVLRKVRTLFYTAMTGFTEQLRTIEMAESIGSRPRASIHSWIFSLSTYCRKGLSGSVTMEFSLRAIGRNFVAYSCNWMCRLYRKRERSDHTLKYAMRRDGTLASVRIAIVCASSWESSSLPQGHHPPLSGTLGVDWGCLRNACFRGQIHCAFMCR